MLANDNTAEEPRGAIAIHCEDHYNGWLSCRGSVDRPVYEAWVSSRGYPCMWRMAIFESPADAQMYLDLNREILTKRCDQYGFLGFKVCTITGLSPEEVCFTEVVALQATKRSLQ